MTRVDMRAALDLLPRWTRANAWKPDGKCCLTCAKVLPKNVDRYIRKLVDQMGDLEYEPHIERVDVSGNNIWVLHASLRVKSLMFLYKRLWDWQNWPDKGERRLPIYIRYNGKVVIWNGTHRMTLCRLAGRKVRARVWDINKFVEWRKTHPNGNCKVLTVGGKKNGNKAKRKHAKPRRGHHVLRRGRGHR